MARFARWEEPIHYDHVPSSLFHLAPKQVQQRAQRRIPYDDRFLKATCPTTIKGTAVVQKQDGPVPMWNDI